MTTEPSCAAISKQRDSPTVPNAAARSSDVTSTIRQYCSVGKVGLSRVERLKWTTTLELRFAISALGEIDCTKS